MNYELLVWCCRARRSTSYLFTLLLFYSFTLKYCCPVKTFSYGFREAGPLCETHCKPQSGAAVGGKDARGGSPKGDLCHWRSAGCISPASRNIILSYGYAHGCAVQPSKRAQICKCFGAFLRQPAAEIRPAQCLAET